MAAPNSLSAPNDPKYLRLLWLYRLRWGAIVGQIAIFLIAFFVLNLTISIQPFAAILLLSFLSNYLLGKALRQEVFSKESLAASAIISDVLLLSALLYFYGGHTNPFSMMYLTLVVLAALFLGGSWSLAVLLLSSALFLSLSFYYVPVAELSLHHHDGANTFSLHLQGMLLAFFLIGALISYFVSRLNLDLKRNEKELGHLRIKAAQESKLAALTTLAAGAAHELATPLGTIALVANEMDRTLTASTDNELCADIKTIQQEVKRCEEILQGMGANSGEMLGELPDVTTAEAVMENLCKKLNPDYLARLKISLPESKTLLTAPVSALVSSLFSLVKNAFDASSPTQAVSLEIKPDPDEVSFVISDNGSGISQETLERIGEPFFTTKQPGNGLGLGVFLVTIFAKRFGGILKYSAKAQGGTVACLTIPRGISNA